MGVQRTVLASPSGPVDPMKDRRDPPLRLRVGCACRHCVSLLSCLILSVLSWVPSPHHPGRCLISESKDWGIDCEVGRMKAGKESRSGKEKAESSASSRDASHLRTSAFKSHSPGDCNYIQLNMHLQHPLLFITVKKSLKTKLHPEIL